MLDPFLTSQRIITECNAEISQQEPNVATKLMIDAKHCVERKSCTLCNCVGASGLTLDGLQQHHIAGKLHGQPNFNDTLTVCRLCHQFLTDHQRAWLLSRNEPSIRVSSYFFGWADIFDLLHCMSKKLLFKNLATRFRAKGYDIRNMRRRQKPIV